VSGMGRPCGGDTSGQGRFIQCVSSHSPVSSADGGSSCVRGLPRLRNRRRRPINAAIARQTRALPTATPVAPRPWPGVTCRASTPTGHRRNLFLNLDPAVERPLECVPRGALIANRPRRNAASSGFYDNALQRRRAARGACSKGRSGHYQAGEASDDQDRQPRQTIACSTKRSTAESRLKASTAQDEATLCHVVKCCRHVLRYRVCEASSVPVASRLLGVGKVQIQRVRSDHGIGGSRGVAAVNRRRVILRILTRRARTGFSLM
jgi:hypothetical protein